MECILKSLDAIKGANAQCYQELTSKLNRLERDVAAGQEETAQLIVKQIQWEPTQPPFKRKGNERQFVFNVQVNDSVQTAVGLLEKIKPEQQQAAAILKTTKEQLEEDMKAITERQKLIRFADHSPYGWGVVEEYLQEDIAKYEEEAKKWADAEKSMETKMRRRRTLDDRDYSNRDPQHTHPMPPPPPPPVFVPPPPPPQPLMSSRAFGPRGPPPRLPGPCFNCLQMVHLRTQCPLGANRPYPLNDVLLTSVDSSFGNKYFGCSISDSKFNGVSIPHGVANTVDRIPADAAQSPHNNSLNDVILASVDSGTVNKYDEVRVYVS